MVAGSPPCFMYLCCHSEMCTCTLTGNSYLCPYFFLSPLGSLSSFKMPYDALTNIMQRDLQGLAISKHANTPKAPTQELGIVTRHSLNLNKETVLHWEAWASNAHGYISKVKCDRKYSQQISVINHWTNGDKEIKSQVDVLNQNLAAVFPLSLCQCTEEILKPFRNDPTEIESSIS